MIQKVFSIRDIKGETYHSPFFKQTHGEAERDFRTVVNDDKSTINKYPADFDLWYVGEYDTNTGELIPTKPQCVISALNCLISKQ